jgi:NADH-quinone oxidoreductase subunit A
MTHSYLTILIMLIISVSMGGLFLAAAWFLGRHQRNPSKLSPYEGGVPQIEESRKRMNVRFYQIAMLFILFDIEAAFLYPWAVIYREATVTPQGIAWFAFAEMIVFIVLLGVGYVYVWKKRALDWK